MSVEVTLRSTDGRHTVTTLMGQAFPEFTEGRGGWAEVTRPRRPGVIEWVGTAPAKASLSLMFDGWRTGTAVGTKMAALEAMAPLAPTVEPPTILITNAWPIPSNIPWQIQTITWDASTALRSSANMIVRAEARIELVERRIAETVIARSSPAKRAAAKTSKATTTTKKVRTVTVKKGDTLSSIAARLLGSSAKWTLIAKANNLRSPNNIKPGQVLKLP